jgi:TPR repeat protein
MLEKGEGLKKDRRRAAALLQKACYAGLRDVCPP